jgi:hypothetical protein
VNEPVGGNGRRRGLPKHNVTHQSWRTGQVATDSGEVEGADGVDETFQRTVFEAAGTKISNLYSVDPRDNEVLTSIHQESGEQAAGHRPLRHTSRRSGRSQ